jgi:hypothetical protein
MVSLTKLDEDSDYTTRKAAIARQQKLAEALSQMGAQEQAVSTAGGITAPMSPMGALARGLTSFGGSYLAGKASADEAALKKVELSEAKDYYANRNEKPAPYRLPGEGGAAPMDLNIVDPVTGRAAMTTAPRSMQEQRDYAAEARFSDNPMIRSMADSLEARATPKFANLGARGAMDTNPDSPTYRQVIGAPPEENEAPKVTGGLQWNGKTWEEIPGYTKQQEAIARARRPDVIGSGPFGGKSLPAQFMNTIITGNPSSPEYAFAYNSLSNPRVTVDPDTMQPITIPGMDMSRFSKPIGPVVTGSTGLTPVVGSAIGETKDIKDARVTLKVFDNQLKTLEQDLKKPTLAEKSLYATTGVSRGGMASALGSYNAMVTISRDPVLINTGVLQPAELKYMNGFLNNPGTIKGMLSGDKSTIEAFNKLRGIVSSRLKGKQEVYGTGPATPGAGAGGAKPDPLGIR